MSQSSTHALFARAQDAVRNSLRASPLSIAALALAAGLSATPAQAQWGSTQYENVGRSVGYELGRQAAGGGGVFSPGARIAGSIGEILVGNLARPLDQAANAAREREAADLRAQREMADVERRARLQAAADAAYHAERLRRDPTYTPDAAYPAAAQAAARANERYSAIRGNLDRLTQQQERLTQEFLQRNAPRAR